mmetsp:Transcript_18857/g.31693  ORF Transcript_18857/g.31693 Transcript_18857/m.31693 type:complete len:290 (-) Transcript_18857:208-1077(-)
MASSKPVRILRFSSSIFSCRKRRSSSISMAIFSAICSLVSSACSRIFFFSFSSSAVSRAASICTGVAPSFFPPQNEPHGDVSFSVVICMEANMTAACSACSVSAVFSRSFRSSISSYASRTISTMEMPDSSSFLYTSSALSREAFASWYTSSIRSASDFCDLTASSEAPAAMRVNISPFAATIAFSANVTCCLNSSRSTPCEPPSVSEASCVNATSRLMRCLRSTSSSVRMILRRVSASDLSISTLTSCSPRCATSISAARRSCCSSYTCSRMESSNGPLSVCTRAVDV